MNPEDKQLHILVAGGAGYIGSVTTARLIEAGHRVTVIDNLSKGHKSSIHPEAAFVEGDIADKNAIAKACSDSVDVALHFAAYIEVGESVKNPAKYYENNLVKSIKYFDNLISAGVNKVVFSSTAAVYGEPDNIPIAETDSLHPVNPYGHSKLMIEQVMQDYDTAYGLKSIALRYFNAGGAFGAYGEDHHPESHLIPLILNSVVNGTSLKVFGDDYESRDGSCVRDYIHVKDLADAHLLAALHLAGGGSSDAFNLGTGDGYTVFEVIKSVEKVTGKSVKYDVVGRRDGDSAALVASSEKARTSLGWNKKLASLESIIETAWKWKLDHPNGYGE